MKYRQGFVTNSSSSSFLITNKTNETLTMKDIIMSYFEDILKDCDENFEYWSLEPGEQISMECTDHRDESEVEAFIHRVGSFYSSLYSNKVSISELENHH